MEHRLRGGYKLGGRRPVRWSLESLESPRVDKRRAPTEAGAVGMRRNRFKGIWK